MVVDSGHVAAGTGLERLGVQSAAEAGIQHSRIEFAGLLESVAADLIRVENNITSCFLSMEEFKK